jgi:hypothetical protein
MFYMKYRLNLHDKSYGIQNGMDLPPANAVMLQVNVNIDQLEQETRDQNCRYCQTTEATTG